MKKNLIALTLGVTALVGFGLAGCKSNNKESGTTTPHHPIKNSINFETAYDQSALSGISLLNSGVSSVAPMSVSLVKEQKLPLNDQMKQQILANLAIAENTLNGGFVKGDTVASDKAEYTFMYDVTSTDLAGNKEVYTFYYNEEAVTEDEDDEDDDEEVKNVSIMLVDEDEDDDDEAEADKLETNEEENEEDEKETKIVGIILNGDKVYNMTGESEIEADEISYEYNVSIDANNYVLIEQEIENEETEFAYSKYENGKCILETEVEYEINKNGELELSFETEKDGVELEYSFNYINNEMGNFIAVEFENGNEEEIEALIRVTINENNEVLYEFVDKMEPAPEVTPEETKPVEPEVTPEETKPVEPEQTPEVTDPVQPDETPVEPEQTPEVTDPVQPDETPVEPETTTPVQPDETPVEPEQTPEVTDPVQPDETPVVQGILI